MTNRRKFLTGTLGVVAAAAAPELGLFAAPCPPPLSGAPNPRCGAGPTSLSDAAESLSPGDYIQFTKNTTQNEWDIQWSLQTIFYDEARGELQYMGKPASGQSMDFSHYLYSESTDNWTAVARPLVTDFGHVWSLTSDPATGNLYFGQEAFDEVWTFNRSLGVSQGSWSTGSSTGPTTGGQMLSAGGLSAQIIGWHPNLFGPGEGGVYAQGAFFAFAYNPRTDQWSLISEAFPSGSPFRDRNNGQCLYLPGTDRLVVFASDNGNSGGRAALWIEAGAGNSSDMIGDGLASGTGQPPIPVFGGGGATNHGHVVNHPNDANKLLLLDEHGSSRVWASTDFGASWALQSFTHPFQGMSSSSTGEYTVGTISPYGVVIGMTSNTDGGETVLWKPNS